MKKENGFSKILLILIVLVIICGIGGFIAYNTYNSLLEPLQSNSEKIVVTITEGSGISGIADKLEKEGVIKSANAFKVYCKLSKDTITMQAGKYELDKSMSVQDIVKNLSSGQIVDETVKITFVEGKNMRNIASVIAKKTNNTEEDIFNLLQNEEYIDSLIKKYWFIDEDIKDEDIYYSLEGYLYPDTYILADKNEDVKTIFGRMLDKMESILNEYKEDIENSKYSVHELLSLASVVELEAKNDEDRDEVAGVFYNRLNRKMALQSDVTTYYACKIDMSERDLTAAELARKNPYNTRSSSMAGKLPVGPICMVSKTSIKAAITPKDTDAIFFVADKNGKVYFSKTNSEHEKIINDLKKQGLWYTYEE